MSYKKLIPLILAGFVICMLCLAGCISGDGFGTPALKGDGFQDRTTAAISDSFLLQEALNSFNETLVVTQPGSSFEVFIIHGGNLTMDGTASRWIIGYKEGTNNGFFTYDSTGQSLIPWRAWLPGTAIQVNQVIMPEDIFSLHSAEITALQNPVTGKIDTLELRDTTYTLSTQTGDSLKNIRIDALSGEIVP